MVHQQIAFQIPILGQNSDAMEIKIQRGSTSQISNII